MVDPRTPAPSADPGALSLVVQAGGLRLALPFGAVAEVSHRVPGPPVPVPGSAPWLIGLIAWRGRLLTLVDAGRLFGEAPSRGGALVLLKGLPVETALAVDDTPRPTVGPGEGARRLELPALQALPALQPGAASGREA
jgi:chemotaxis signal transduction protein